MPLNLVLLVIAPKAAPTVAHSVRHWLLHLGGVGLIPLGLLDNSILPLPGSMDILTILLTARDPHYWVYFALMATLGSLLGGYVTYRLAKKGGKELLSRRFSERSLKRVYAIFERHGFASIAIPALLPPPTPMTPFLFAAGALQYPVRKFLLALALGRAGRYAILAYLASIYGRQIIRFFSAHGLLIGACGAIVIAGTLLITIRNRNRSR
jgi:membrane protein YqaA with SNARE-associated domain